MKSTKFFFLLFIPFIFLSCFEDDDDNGANYNYHDRDDNKEGIYVRKYLKLIILLKKDHLKLQMKVIKQVKQRIFKKKQNWLQL